MRYYEVDPLPAPVCLTPNAPSFALEAAYPNPFNSATTIACILPRAGVYSLRVVDLSGREVTRLLEGWRAAGRYQAVWNVAGAASGAYQVILQSPQGMESAPVRLVK